MYVYSDDVENHYMYCSEQDLDRQQNVIIESTIMCCAEVLQQNSQFIPLFITGKTV